MPTGALLKRTLRTSAGVNGIGSPQVLPAGALPDISGPDLCVSEQPDNHAPELDCITSQSGQPHAPPPRSPRTARGSGVRCAQPDAPTAPCPKTRQPAVAAGTATLSSTPPAVQSAPRVEAVGKAAPRHAAQVRHRPSGSEAASP